MKDFHPIALCNVLYKLISKVIANRLKKLLPNIVFEFHPTFVRCRLITDNVLVAFEILHHMMCKHKGQIGEVTLKVDINKAYDQVEWNFLKNILLRLSFQDEWVDLVMLLVELVWFQVNFNGNLMDFFSPQRGLRQGDAISPYLFILHVEGLSSLLSQTQSMGIIYSWLKGLS